MSDAVPSTAVAHVFHPDDPRAPNGDPRAFWVNHCENIDSQESEDGMVMLTASCPLCPARSGSRFWLPKSLLS